MSRFNRTKFYKEKMIDNNPELDFLLGDIQDFEIKRECSFHTIREEDVKRPELLSYKLYGNQAYWWILMYINEIHDVWNDMIVGTVIQVPHVKDIQEWYLKRNIA